MSPMSYETFKMYRRPCWSSSHFLCNGRSVSPFSRSPGLRVLALLVPDSTHGSHIGSLYHMNTVKENAMVEALVPALDGE